MKLSHENELLLYCARNTIHKHKPKKIQDIIKLPLNWNKVLKSTLRHGISPLLYHTLKDIQESHLIPQEVMDRLRKDYYGNLVRNMFIYEQLKRILDAFREEGVEVIVLKGAALAETVYDDIGLRSMNDIDLLVREQDLDRAEELMAELGYFSYEGWRSKDWYRRNHHHLAPFINQDNGIKIEIHRDIILPGKPFYVDIRKSWDRVQDIIIEGVNTLILSPEDLIIHLCLHSSLQPFKRDIRNLIDISEVVSFYGERINWDLIIREAYEGNFTGFIYYPLCLARDILRMEIEREIFDALKNGFHLRPFEESLLMLAAQKSILLRDDSSSIFPKWLLQALCKELIRESHILNKLGSLLKIIFLPRTKSIEKNSQTSIQKLSYFFYPILRLLKLTFKFCYLLGRSMTKIVFRKMALKFTH
jgi:hypothetical protein